MTTDYMKKLKRGTVVLDCNGRGESKYVVFCEWVNGRAIVIGQGGRYSIASHMVSPTSITESDHLPD
jgi:hypothetical protein